MNHDKMLISGFISLILVNFVHSSSHPLEFVTDYFLSSQQDDVIAAYGDFNDDKLTDVFLISANASRVDLLLAREHSGSFERSFERHKLIDWDPDSPSNTTVITGVMLADFDGDVQMDILVTRREMSKKDSSNCNVQIYWGKSAEVSVDTKPYIFENEFKDQPLVFDYEGNMLPDLLGETSKGDRPYIWISHANRNFTRLESVFTSETKFADYNSNAFIDIDSNGVADLVLALENKKFEVWTNSDGVLGTNYSYVFDIEGVDQLGMSSFYDYNQDANIDHLLPVCMDSSCSQSKIYIRHNDSWMNVMNNITDPDGNVWGFVPRKNNKYYDATNFTFPIKLRTGDFNMDGFSDLMAILRSGDKQKAFFMTNVPCNADFCKEFGRTFQPIWDTQLSTIDAAIQTSFFDLYDDGNLDVILVSLTTSKNTNRIHPVINLLRNDITGDTCFIKVLVGTGVCNRGNDCPEGRNPWGTNQPGPTIRIATTKADGSLQINAAGQLSQSSHFSLQLPYNVFGLGQTPNFVDNMRVTIPQSTQSKEKLQQEWPMIIPNSQLIVIPSPYVKPSKWQLKLFLTPSRMVYLTGAALIGTCGFVAGIVGVLHWREKREDAVEKKQEAQKFHFDAM